MGHGGNMHVSVVTSRSIPSGHGAYVGAVIPGVDATIPGIGAVRASAKLTVRDRIMNTTAAISKVSIRSCDI